MNGFTQETYTPEKIFSGATIPVKVVSTSLKAGESINELQPVYYDSVNKEFTIKNSHSGESSSTVNHEIYGLSSTTVEVDSESVSKTEIPVYLTGEFYKSAVSLVLSNEEDIDSLALDARKIGIFLD